MAHSSLFEYILVNSLECVWLCYLKKEKKTQAISRYFKKLCDEWTGWFPIYCCCVQSKSQRNNISIIIFISWSLLWKVFAFCTAICWISDFGTGKKQGVTFAISNSIKKIKQNGLPWIYKVTCLLFFNHKYLRK